MGQMLEFRVGRWSQKLVFPDFEKNLVLEKVNFGEIGLGNHW